MHSTRFSQLLLLSACMVSLPGCDGAGTTAGVNTVSPALDFTNGPLTPGPFILRIDGQRVFFFSADEKNNLMSIHFPLDVFLCGGGATPNLADAQFVVTPSEVQKVLALIQDGDGAVAVYGTSDFTEAFGPGGPLSDLPHMCAFMNGEKKLAEGTARRVSVFTTTSFSGAWTGTLTDADGHPVQYAEHQAFVVNPQTGVHTIVTATINLH